MAAVTWMANISSPSVSGLMADIEIMSQPSAAEKNWHEPVTTVRAHTTYTCSVSGK